MNTQKRIGRDAFCHAAGVDRATLDKYLLSHLAVTARSRGKIESAMVQLGVSPASLAKQAEPEQLRRARNRAQRPEEGSMTSGQQNEAASAAQVD